MNLLILVLRLIHVVTGVFWVGTVVFVAAFLFPSLLEAGPDAAKVAAGLMKRRFLDIVPGIAALTLLSGLWLYWKDAGGLHGTFMQSAMGITLAIGAVFAIVGFSLGVSIMRPSMLKAAQLTQAAAGMASPAREQQLGQAQALRLRAGATGQVVAWLLLLAAACMAVARYV